MLHGNTLIAGYMPEATIQANYGFKGLPDIFPRPIWAKPVGVAFLQLDPVSTVFSAVVPIDGSGSDACCSSGIMSFSDGIGRCSGSVCLNSS